MSGLRATVSAAVVFALVWGSTTANKPAAAPETRPSTQPAYFEVRGRARGIVGDVPEVYIDADHDQRLTAEQKKDILTGAAPLCPKGQRIWFIRVHDSHIMKEAGWTCLATVYFTPHVRTGRIRKGRAAYVQVFPAMTAEAFRRKMLERVEKDSEDLRRAIERMEPPKKETTASLGDYCQVSIKEKPFGRKLGVPEGTLLPFGAPEGFTDEEIVEIVDFVRTNPGMEHKPNAIPGRLDGSKPILFIKRGNESDRQLLGFTAKRQAEDARKAGVPNPHEVIHRRLLATPDAIKDLINVWTGWSRGLVWGAGESIKFVKTRKSFVVLSIGFWVS